MHGRQPCALARAAGCTRRPDRKHTHTHALASTTRKLEPLASRCPTPARRKPVTVSCGAVDARGAWVSCLLGPRWRGAERSHCVALQPRAMPWEHEHAHAYSGLRERSHATSAAAQRAQPRRELQTPLRAWRACADSAFPVSSPAGSGCADRQAAACAAASRHRQRPRRRARAAHARTSSPMTPMSLPSASASPAGAAIRRLAGGERAEATGKGECSRARRARRRRRRRYSTRTVFATRV